MIQQWIGSKARLSVRVGDRRKPFCETKCPAKHGRNDPIPLVIDITPEAALFCLHRDQPLTAAVQPVEAWPHDNLAGHIINGCFVRKEIDFCTESGHSRFTGSWAVGLQAHCAMRTVKPGVRPKNHLTCGP